MKDTNKTVLTRAEQRMQRKIIRIQKAAIPENIAIINGEIQNISKLAFKIERAVQNIEAHAGMIQFAKEAK